MRRVALAFVLSAGLFAVLGAGASSARADAPAEVQCPAQAGASTLTDGSARPVAAEQAEVVTCRYGTDGDAVIQVTYGARTGTFPIGCHTLDQRTDVTVGSGFDPTGALSGDHFGGTIDDPDHALSTTWTTTHAADASAVKAAALELARHLAPLARGCGSPTATTTGGGASSGTNTPAAIALLGGGLLVTAGGVLVGVRGGRKPAKVVEPPPDDRIVSGADAINVLLQSGLVQPVTRPDGSIGYAPVGDLVQFDHHPQWRVPLHGQSIVDGEQFHDLGALAYNEHPDGTFDTATIVVGVQPATPPPDAPAPTAPVSPPTDPDATPLGDALAKEFLPEDLGRAWQTVVDPLPFMPPPFIPWVPQMTPPSAPVDNTDAWNRACARRDAGMDEQRQHLTSAKHWGWLETGGEITGWLADRAIDVLANMAGPGAKGVKDVYTVTSKLGKGIGEAFATGDATNVAMGAAEGVFDLGWGNGVDKLQGLDKIPGFRADTPVLPAGTATRVVGQVVGSGSPTVVVPRPMNISDAMRAAFRSWVRDTVVRDPVKRTIGF